MSGFPDRPAPGRAELELTPKQRQAARGSDGNPTVHNRFVTENDSRRDTDAIATDFNFDVAVDFNGDVVYGH